jgi:hypothetical protein
MLDKIKNIWFYKAFNVKAKTTLQKPIISNKGSQILILFNGTHEEDRKTVHRLKKKLISSGASSVKSLAFIDNALPLDNVDYAAYNKKNITWYGKPVGDKVEAFMNAPADMLIVLCAEMLPHYEYIIAHAQAPFIMGPDIAKSTLYFNLTVQYPASNNLEDMVKAIIQAVDVVAIKD